MKIGALGTGQVGNTIGSKLIELGHQVMMGSRKVNNEKAIEWAQKNGQNASQGTFEDAARFGQLIFLCTQGAITLQLIKQTDPTCFTGKTIIDLTNPLDFSQGVPPSLIPIFSNTTSLGEEIQKALPKANIVKTLNNVSHFVMVNPKRTNGDPTMFISGNSPEAKEEAIALLKEFGWTDIIDLGDISTARGTEMMLPIWLRIWATTSNGNFAFKVIR